MAADAAMARAVDQEERNQLQEEDVDATGEGDWIEAQSGRKAKKGKGKAWQTPKTPTKSSTEMPFLRADEIGPLATASRVLPPPPPPAAGARAASEPRRGRGLQERHRSPRQPQVGTPAQPAPTAAGTLGATPAPAEAEAAGTPTGAGGASGSNQRGGSTETRPATGL